MLDQMKIAGALAGLMKNKDQLKEGAERVKAKLADMQIPGEAGGGAVRAIATGKMEILSVTLDPTLAQNLATDPQAGQQLIAEAVNNALLNAREAAQAEVRKEMEAIGMPDIPGLDRLMG